MNSEERASSASPRERRAHPRAAGEWPITILLDDGSHAARLRDISRSGICFYLDRRIPVMTILSVQIDLPVRGPSGGGRVEGRGVVVRCQPIAKALDHYEIAVFLNDLADFQRERLAGFVAAAALT